MSINYFIRNRKKGYFREKNKIKGLKNNSIDMYMGKNI